MMSEIYVLTETISGDPVQVCYLYLSSLSELIPGYLIQDVSETVLSCLIPPPWELGKFTTLKKCTNPSDLWNKFVKDMFVQDSLNESIAEELRSSEAWQCEFIPQ
jgi:hypothetical protein